MAPDHWKLSSLATRVALVTLVVWVLSVALLGYCAHQQLQQALAAALPAQEAQALLNAVYKQMLLTAVLLGLVAAGLSWWLVSRQQGTQQAISAQAASPQTKVGPPPAFFDTLTKLPNRRLLYDRLTQALAASKRTEFYGAVMCLALDNFQQLNDTHGQVAGDLLLVEVTHRLHQCVREVDTLARFERDEFVIVLGELDSDKVESAQQAAAIAEKIRLNLSHPYHLELHRADGPATALEHHSTVSIGVALFLGHEAGEADLLTWADQAMRQAMAAGHDVVRFHGPPV